MAYPIIIIGTGLAGYQLARELRKIDTQRELMLITADNGKYYSKPQLSTALTNKKEASALTTSDAGAMAQQLNATIITDTKITDINPTQRVVWVNEEKFSYAKLVLACGADVIKPQLKGNGVKDILSINHIYHYAQFRELIQNKKRILILGAGLIGCEFANDLTNAGFEVHIVAPSITPLDLLLPAKIGKILQSALEKNGVIFHLDSIANRIDKMDNGFYNVELSNGNELAVEFVLSAIGLKPHVELAKAAEIEINRGIVVNKFLETSQPDIYALGDCAEVEGHVLPFITPLLNCSKALAKTLLGAKTAVDYPAMPVVVKTPAHPIVVCPPPKTVAGSWTITENGSVVRALFHDDNKQLRGFVLTNEAVKERIELVKSIPALF